jgi:hypothetical protein
MALMALMVLMVGKVQREIRVIEGLPVPQVETAYVLPLVKMPVAMLKQHWLIFTLMYANQVRIAAGILEVSIVSRQQMNADVISLQLSQEGIVRPIFKAVKMESAQPVSLAFRLPDRLLSAVLDSVFMVTFARTELSTEIVESDSNRRTVVYCLALY